eukprot:2008604-Rhodomonas_salina.1
MVTQRAGFAPEAGDGMNNVLRTHRVTACKGHVAYRVTSQQVTSHSSSCHGRSRHSRHTHEV